MPIAVRSRSDSTVITAPIDSTRLYDIRGRPPIPSRSPGALSGASEDDAGQRAVVPVAAAMTQLPQVPET
jgi:hypothetical protein